MSSFYPFRRGEAKRRRQSSWPSRRERSRDSPRFEDFLGKAVSIYVFAFLIWVQGHSVVDMARDPAGVHHWELAITARTLACS